MSVDIAERADAAAADLESLAAAIRRGEVETARISYDRSKGIRLEARRVAGPRPAVHVAVEP